MTVAKIHILSFMKDIIDAKLSSMEDRTHKKAFIGRILISQKYSIQKSFRHRNFILIEKALFYQKQHVSCLLGRILTTYIGFYIQILSHSFLRNTMLVEVWVTMVTDTKRLSLKSYPSHYGRVAMFRCLSQNPIL